MISGNYSNNYTHPIPNRVEPIKNIDDRDDHKKEFVVIDVEYEEISGSIDNITCLNSDDVNEDYFIYNSQGKIIKLKKPTNLIITI